MKSGPLGLMILSTLFWMAPLAWSQATVPPIVVTSTSTVPATGLAGDEGDVALDACGNIYAVQQYGGEVDKILAGGGAISVVVAAGNANYDPANIWIDSSKSNLFVTQGTSGSIWQIPITNCVPQTSSQVNIGIGKLGALSYYWNPSAVATDSAEDIFFATDVACCANSNELVELFANGGANPSGTVLLGGTTNLANPITSIAVDSKSNIYYVSGGILYELAVTTPATPTAPALYSSTPVLFGSGYVNVVGVALDGAGNLYVADQGTGGYYAVNGYYPEIYLSSVLYVIPNQASALNPADQYILAEGSGTTNPLTFAATPAISAQGSIFFGAANSGVTGSAVYEMTQGNANFGAVALGNNSSGTMTVAFNAAETPAAFQLTGPSSVFTSTGGSCAPAISYTVGQSCTVTASFAPAAPGISAGGLTITNSSGAALAGGYLTGTGMAPALNADPGVVSSFGTGYTAPTSVAIDSAGDLFFADSSQKAVLEVKAGTTAAVTLGSGLAAPTGVVVDGAGNVYVSDTGNDRIVEIPVVNGALSTAAQTTVISSSASVAGMTLSKPAGLTIDSLGNLYIADSGNKRAVYVPYTESWNLPSAITLGSGMSSPSAIAVDSAGDAFVADAGNGNIYKLTAPPGVGAQVTVASGYSSPSGLTMDASGALFVVDRGNNKVWRIPNPSGTLAPASAVNVTGQLNSFGKAIVADPYGVALDPAGDLYVSDNVNGAAYVVNRTNSTQSFGIWTAGTQSGVQTYYVENSGTAALTLGSPFDVASGNTTQFTILSTETGACASGASVGVGSSCDLDAQFTPTANGSYTDTLTLASNAYISGQQLAFTGTAAITTATTTTLAVTAPTGAVSYDQAVTLTATVTASTGTPVGSVSLVVDGITKQTVTLNSSGTAQFTLAAGSLTGGSHVLQANYLGALSGSIAYSQSSSTPLNLNVLSVATSTAVSFTTLYAGPVSQPEGIPIVFTATVSSAYAGVPSGTVTFTITDSSGTIVTGNATLAPATGGVFQATYTYANTKTPAGGAAFDAQSVVATYSGDQNFSKSTSAAGSFDVAPTIGAVTVTASGTTLTSSATSPSSITFNATSYGGWTGVVGFSCLASSLPANARCVFSPGYLDITPSTPGTAAFNSPVTLTVTIDQPPQTPTASRFFWWLAGPTGLLLLFARRRFRSGAFATITMALALIFAGIAASGIVACTSGNIFTTPAGASTVTVYAAADPWVSGSTSTTQTCGINSATGLPSTALSPCSQQTFQVALTVQ